MFNKSSSELDRYIEARLAQHVPGMPLSKQTRREINGVAVGTGMAIFKEDAAATVAAHSMQNIIALVEQARALAGDDPVKQALCADILQTYANRGKRSHSTLGW